MMEGPRVRPKLRRIKGKGWLGGVCAGFGYWLGIPTWLVRLIWTALALAYGVGAVLYILLWVFTATFWTMAESMYVADVL